MCGRGSRAKRRHSLNEKSSGSFRSSEFSESSVTSESKVLSGVHKAAGRHIADILGSKRQINALVLLCPPVTGLLNVVPSPVAFEPDRRCCNGRSRCDPPTLANLVIRNHCIAWSSWLLRVKVVRLRIKHRVASGAVVGPAEFHDKIRTGGSVDILPGIAVQSKLQSALAALELVVSSSTNDITEVIVDVRRVDSREECTKHQKQGGKLRFCWRHSVRFIRLTKMDLLQQTKWKMEGNCQQLQYQTICSQFYGRH
ncbi:hypothetical protein K457DRAFT_842294, partial [Linnemannia elongata AG-77]